MTERRDWERAALEYLAVFGVVDLRAKFGAGRWTTDVPGHRLGVLYTLETRELVASRGYGRDGTKWTITEAGLAYLAAERARRAGGRTEVA